MGALSSELEAELEARVDAEAIARWDDLPPSLRDRIQHAVAPGQEPDCVVSPASAEALGRVVQFAHRRGLGLIPAGNASKLHWGGVVENARIVLRMHRLDRIVEHAAGDLTLTVEAGAKLQTVSEMLAKSRQFLAIDPTYADDATIGGIVATADMGSWRQQYNSIRDRLIGVSFVRSDGEAVKAGGRVVKNVAGYDLMKLLTGAYGTLGILTQLTFRLYPLPEDSETVVATGEVEAIARVSQALRSSSLVPSAFDLVSPALLNALDFGDGTPGDRAIGLCARFQNVAPSVRQQCDRLLELTQNEGLTAQRLRDDPERNLWRRSQQHLETGTPDDRLLLKLGVRPAETVATLQRIDDIFQGTAIARLHAGSGLGLLHVPRDRATTAYLMQLRRHCQSCGGFLTILEAPQSLKRQIDIWGYSGSATAAMERIKQQFDPQTILSPKRFVVG